VRSGILDLRNSACRLRPDPDLGAKIWSGEARLHAMVCLRLGSDKDLTPREGAQMTIRPEELAELVAIPVEAAQLILSVRPGGLRVARIG